LSGCNLQRLRLRLLSLRTRLTFCGKYIEFPGRKNDSVRAKFLLHRKYMSLALPIYPPTVQTKYHRRYTLSPCVQCPTLLHKELHSLVSRKCSGHPHAPEVLSQSTISQTTPLTMVECPQRNVRRRYLHSILLVTM
jgi:hypothetical protein